jgi:hypothetical protein
MASPRAKQIPQLSSGMETSIDNAEAAENERNQKKYCLTKTADRKRERRWLNSFIKASEFTRDSK